MNHLRFYSTRLSAQSDSTRPEDEYLPVNNENEIRVEDNEIRVEAELHLSSTFWQLVAGVGDDVVDASFVVCVVGSLEQIRYRS